MSICQTNQPKNTDDPVNNKLRKAFIHRALWMGLLLKEMKDRGLDWEEIGHSAIFKTGCMHGEGISEQLASPDSLVEFGKTFLNEDVIKVFEMEIKKLDENDRITSYNVCYTKLLRHRMPFGTNKAYQVEDLAHNLWRQTE